MQPLQIHISHSHIDFNSDNTFTYSTWEILGFHFHLSPFPFLSYLHRRHARASSNNRLILDPGKLFRLKRYSPLVKPLPLVHEREMFQRGSAADYIAHPEVISSILHQDRRPSCTETRNGSIKDEMIFFFIFVGVRFVSF